MSSAPLDRDQVLDEVELLARVENALIVEYLSVQCALGHDLEAEDGGATTDEGRSAAQAASILAQGEMFRLKDTNQALLAAGRSAQLERAGSVADATGSELPLAPPTRAQLEQLLQREDAIAATVDARFDRLRPAVATAGVFDGDLLDTLQSLVHRGTTHTEGVAALHEAMGDVAPAFFLRAVRRDPHDVFEQRVLDVADRGYQSVVAALRESVADHGGDPFVGGTFQGFAITAMTGLDDVHRLLVSRGLLPPFAAG